MTGRSFRVRVLADWDAWSAYLHAVPTSEGENPHVARVRHIAENGETILRFHGDWGFTWICPGCGMACGGNLGATPVSGWDKPCWVNSGTHERPTLTPSLGCPTWRRGDCPGHWWLRYGKLILA